MTTSTRRYAGRPAADRARERRARLLEAALEIIGSDGFAALTVDGVCAQAQLTKRYFYESFTDRDALVLCALDDLFDAIADGIRRVVAGTEPGPARARAVVEHLVAALADDPRRARLYVECTAQDVLRARRTRAIDDFTRLVCDEVFEFEGPRRRSVDRRLAARVVVSGTTDVVTGWLDGTVRCSRRTLVETIVALGQGAVTAL